MTLLAVAIALAIGALITATIATAVVVLARRYDQALQAEDDARIAAAVQP